MKLLFVEDEKGIATPVIRILNKQGYLVDYAEDGEIAMNFVRNSSYDCIILDLNLPKVDGMEIAKYVRDNSKTPILMLTARSQIYDKLEGFDSGADDYLTKPFELQELLARINALIKRKQP